MQNMQTWHDLTVGAAKALIGKKIRWQAPAYKGNGGRYSGVAVIVEVKSDRRPLVTKDDEGGLHFAFFEYYHLGETGDNILLAYSDGGRYLSYQLADDATA